ncbi:NADPH-dependent FMN reductase [Aquamicrobium defluvii]|uniref:FMN reductase n=1 Tax=Aquamicrobium defluvii TaxID=69279 RepID=A0A011V317_9HYPH|nr:NAD(P)H-dependent oxidoreductase [Aquamicrobium defluvii]EXL02875.1 FMN reductase [Aquamicrobium defluvii]EZQ13360.1 FMN reductase [Halopseudomonas bauzanensis]TDR33214.1 NAD(P)H-dependent FMN reductase [Aquamicrobium defluvii]
MPSSRVRIAVVIGSVREKRFAEKPARWIADLVNQRDDAEAGIVDLKDYPMAMFAEDASPLWAPSKDEHARRWQARLDEFDGYIFTAAEYNHAPTGVLKNAFDYAGSQVFRKPAGFVGYGGVGGARAVEHLRLIAVEMQMAPVRAAVHILRNDFVAIMQGQDIAELEHLKEGADGLLNDIVWWAKALRTARVAEEQAKAA